MSYWHRGDMVSPLLAAFLCAIGEWAFRGRIGVPHCPRGLPEACCDIDSASLSDRRIIVMANAQRK